MSPTDRVRKQTVKEWLDEYNRYSPDFNGIYTNTKESNTVISSSTLAQNLPDKFHEDDHKFVTFKFVEHRTYNRNGSGQVALAFESSDGDEIVMFYNVDLTRQRGSKKRGAKKGDILPTGVGEEFFPPEKGKFREFYMRIIGVAPTSWSRVAKCLKARFSGITLQSNKHRPRENNGKKYLQVYPEDVQKIEIKKA